MKYIILSLLITAGSARAQNIFRTATPQKGIYANAQEFLKNDPSISLESIRIEESFKYLAKNVRASSSGFDPSYNNQYVPSEQSEVLQGDLIELPVTELFDRTSGKKIKSKEYWGYSDGVNIYVNSRSQVKSWHYAKIEVFGRYSYFMQIGTPMFLKNAQHYNYFSVDEFVVDALTGEIIRLSHTKLKKLFADDDVLFHKVKQAYTGSDSNKGLIIQYNHRYRKKSMQN